MSKVSLVKCNDYSKSKEMISEAVKKLGGFEKFIKKDAKVLIKPNICDPFPKECAVCTNPDFVKAIIELIRPITKNIWVGDASGGFARGATERSFKKAGYLELENIKLLNFQLEDTQIIPTEKYFYYKQMDVFNPIEEADVIINVPKLKGHRINVITGAVKNLFGCIKGELRDYLHKKHMPYVSSSSPKVRYANSFEFGKALTDVYSAIKPQLTIMDAILGMDGQDAPTKGNPKEINFILASNDGVAVDSIASKLIGVRNPMHVPTNYLSEKLGIGIANWDKIEVLGENPNEHKIKDFEFVNFYQDILFEEYFNDYIKADENQKIKEFHSELFAPILVVINNKLLEQNSIEVVKNYINENFSKGVKRALFYEDYLLNKEILFTLLDLVHNLKRVRIHSNSLAFKNHDFFQKLLSKNITDFSLTVNSFSDFESLRNVIKEILTEKKELSVFTIVTEENYTHLPKLAKFLLKLKVKEWILCANNGLANDIRGDLIPNLFKLKPFLLKALSKAKEGRMRVSTQMIPLCYLSGFEKTSVKRMNLDESELLLPYLDNPMHFTNCFEKNKVVKCRKCALELLCEGVWKNYSKKYFFNPTPIKGEKKTSWTQI